VTLQKFITLCESKGYNVKEPAEAAALVPPGSSVSPHLSMPTPTSTNTPDSNESSSLAMKTMSETALPTAATGTGGSATATSKPSSNGGQGTSKREMAITGAMVMLLSMVLGDLPL